MPRITATVESPVHRSFRVAQVEGMFDLTICNQAQRFQIDLPSAGEHWQVGLIVGPSGSGKTTIARASFGDAIYKPSKWPADRAIIDGFGDLPINRIVRALTAVGLSSPPSWLKPHQVLSTGERFRCDLARALVECGMRISDCGMKRQSSQRIPQSAPHNPQSIPLVVFDEFSSVVDRRVACLTSAAVGKHVRRSEPPMKFVAVTCHDDVAEWLEPDWILDMGKPDGELSGRLSRKRLRRPRMELAIHRASREAWPAFAPHHYLSGKLHRSAKCFLGTVAISDRRSQISHWEEGSAHCRTDCQSVLPKRESEIPACFAATLPLVGRKGHRRFHRLVVLPDYQGIGIGGRFLDAVAELHREEGLRINIAASHPAVIAHCRGSPRWRTVYVSRTGRKPRVIDGRLHDHSFGRAVVSFEFS